jgi:uncharacterized lipoprotein YddW (UPF0748 family)
MKSHLFTLVLLHAAVAATLGQDPRAKITATEGVVDKEIQLPVVPREFRAVWVATVDNIDWPSKPGLSVDAQKQEMIAILDCCQSLNLNAVIFQVRPTADAFYESELEPWSAYLTGAQGQAPAPPYDPLAFIVKEAHDRALEVHAWFNPFRAQHPSNDSVCDEHVSKTHPEWVRTYGKQLWMDPGEPKALEHTLEVMRDVVRRYDIDGIHVDDYFYPYPIKGENDKNAPFPDDASYEKFQASGGALERNAWRVDNINQLVRRMYEVTKEEKPHVKVGFSPFGIWRPGHPEQIRGFDSVDGLYADAKYWLQQGWMDYLTPQLYWATDPPEQSYPALLAWWVEQNTKNRNIWPGNALYRSTSGQRGWTLDELPRQIHLTRAQPGATGNVFFSMKGLLRNVGQMADRLQQLYSVPALVPASPWIEDQPPACPKLTLEPSRGKTSLWVRIEPGDGEAAAVWTIQARYGRRWKLKIIPSGRDNVELPTAWEGSPCELIAVRAVDRSGNASDAVVLK